MLFDKMNMAPSNKEKIKIFATASHPWYLWAKLNKIDGAMRATQGISPGEEKRGKK
jgi:hypothetical protein